MTHQKTAKIANGDIRLLVGVVLQSNITVHRFCYSGCVISPLYVADILQFFFTFIDLESKTVKGLDKNFQEKNGL